jgi:esterase/lipase superfamily enzyme
MMPTPLLYGQGTTAYDDLNPALETTEVDLLYFTDRTPERDEYGNLQYGIGRSPELAFGTAKIQLGEDSSWAELERDARSLERKDKLVMNLGTIT